VASAWSPRTSSLYALHPIGKRTILTHSQHAFDSSGRLYNQDGKLEEWWTNSTTKAFDARQTCIVDQYSSASVFPPCVAGC
jgi:predicted metalloendopeptidase